MADTEDNEQSLRDLDETIEAGITSTSADGHSASIDLAHLERIRREKRMRDAQAIQDGRVRPHLLGINLRGAW